jgi:hypothetical protein
MLMMVKSKSLVLLLALLFCLVQCGRKGTQVEKITENGVEVVINHLEPYRIPGVPSALKLEEVLSIDTEKDEILKTGLTSIESFCLDGDGNIYFMMRQSPENFIYKFDSSGKFLRSFGRKGQGPGEFDWGGDILIDEENRVIAKDMTKEIVYIFAGDGSLLEEIKLGKSIVLERRLGQKKYLTWWQETDPVKPVMRNHYCISNDRLNENQEFYTYEFDDAGRAPRWRPVGGALILGASDKNIFVGDATGGYEIFVFDFSGKLARKIRKEFRPVPVPEQYKALLKKVMSRYTRGQELMNKLELAAHLAPFRHLFTDDQGRLYVMSSERAGERNYWYDIFTSEGAFIGRFQLDNVRITYVEGQQYSANPTQVVVRGDRLYCLREKDNGFMVMAVYRMIWN